MAKREFIQIRGARANNLQNILAKYGFEYCGIIHIASGAERLAYQRLR